MSPIACEHLGLSGAPATAVLVRQGILVPVWDRIEAWPQAEAATSCWLGMGSGSLQHASALRPASTFELVGQEDEQSSTHGQVTQVC